MATSRAVAAIKRTRVVEAVAAGATYGEAAAQAGYASRSGAYKALWRALEDRQVDAVDEHRAIESARLDALQLALWDDAMAGDVKAVAMVLRIIEQRIRLLGLDRPSQVSAAQTVVMSPAEVAVWAGEGSNAR